MQKTEGNGKYKNREYSEAADFYKDALGVLESVEDNSQEVLDLKVSLNQNLAMCLNFTEDFKEAIHHCDQVISFKPDAAKAFYIKF